MNRILGTMLAAGLVAGCSSRPRAFDPQLAAAPADATAYDRTVDACRTLVAQGHRSGFGAMLASGGAGVATTAGVTTAAVGAGAVGPFMGATAAAAATAALPVIGMLGAWGFAKVRKSKKERAIKQAMGLCLAEQGYEVSGWAVAQKRSAKATPDTALAAAPPATD
jgi:hypothetical protein